MYHNYKKIWYENPQFKISNGVHLAAHRGSYIILNLKSAMKIVNHKKAKAILFTKMRS